MNTNNLGTSITLEGLFKDWKWNHLTDEEFTDKLKIMRALVPHFNTDDSVTWLLMSEYFCNLTRPDAYQAILRIKLTYGLEKESVKQKKIDTNLAVIAVVVAIANDIRGTDIIEEYIQKDLADLILDIAYSTSQQKVPNTLDYLDHFDRLWNRMLLGEVGNQAKE